MDLVALGAVAEGPVWGDFNLHQRRPPETFQHELSVSAAAPSVVPGMAMSVAERCVCEHAGRLLPMETEV